MAIAASGCGQSSTDSGFPADSGLSIRDSSSNPNGESESSGQKGSGGDAAADGTPASATDATTGRSFDATSGPTDSATGFVEAAGPHGGDSTAHDGSSADAGSQDGPEAIDGSSGSDAGRIEAGGVPSADSATEGSSGGAADAAGADASVDSSSSTIVPDPSWTCGMANGIPPPTSGTLVFRASLALGYTHDVGTTPYGHRRILGVTGGTLTGDRITATFLTGGLDLELTLSNGSVELEEIDIFRTSDGADVYVRSCGVAPPGDSVVRVVPDFEAATSSSYAWLNTGKFAGTRSVNAAANTLEFDVYDISTASASGPRITLQDPSGVPNQPWNCSTATGTKGASVFTESVTLGSSVSIASKNGTRNIIPITGGTLSGGETGTILSAGADYQLIGATTTLDARYIVAPSDGEFVIVRNCGPMGALVPLFETRVDGPEAFLNANTYLSSDPSASSNGVSITFYKRQ